MTEIFEATQPAGPDTEGVIPTGGESHRGPVIPLISGKDHFIGNVVLALKDRFGLSGDGQKPRIINEELNRQLREIRESYLQGPIQPPRVSEITTLAE